MQINQELKVNSAFLTPRAIPVFSSISNENFETTSPQLCFFKAEVLKCLRVPWKLWEILFIYYFGGTGV
jgi:hypothetical protein